MAEAAGLVLGVLGVAGLFSVCVQVFDMVQIASTQDHSLRILSTKLDNQKARFIIWGQALGLDDPNGYDRRLDDHLRKRRVCETCKLIHDLFNKSDQLQARYGLTQDVPASNEGMLRITENEVSVWKLTFRRARGRLQAQPTPSAPTGHHQSRHVTRWVIQDRKAFLELVGDLRDLVDDLESLTTFSGVQEARRRITTFEIESISDTDSVQLLQEASAQEDSILSEVASVRALTFSDAQTTRTTFYTAPDKPSSAQEDPATNEGHTHLPLEELVPQNRRLTAAYAREAAPLIAFASSPASCAARITFQWIHQSNLLATATPPPFLPPGGSKRYLTELKAMRASSDVDFVTWRFTQVAGRCGVLGTVLGPLSTPYEGGVFYMLLLFRFDPESYPYKPPVVRFLTKVYHPNIDVLGKVCLDILGEQWSGAHRISTLLVSIASLLADPSEEDPLVPEIAATLITDRAQYDKNALLYTQRYASGDPPVYEEVDRVATSMLREHPESV